MAEDTQGEQAQVTETPAPATPTGEEKTTGSEQVPSNELPQEAKERTKERFDELTNQLKEERQSREALEKAFNTLSKPKADVTPDVVAPIYDPDTGLLNEQALSNVQLRAQEAEKTAQEAKKQLDGYLEDQKKQAQVREDQEAFTAHPELDPNSKVFSKDLRDMTASIMLQSMVHPEDFGDKQLTHKEAGDKAKDLVAKLAGKVSERAAQEAIEQLSPKEQAALDATGTHNQSSNENIETLRQQTRRGNEDAIVARLHRINQSS